MNSFDVIAIAVLTDGRDVIHGIGIVWADMVSLAIFKC